MSRAPYRTRAEWPTRRRVVVWGGVLIIGAGLAGIAIAAPPGVGEAIIRAALVAAGVAASWWALGRAGSLTRSTPERFEAELRPPRFEHHELSRLRELDTAVRMAVSNAFGVEFMLKPRVRELAAWRLQRSRGVELGANPRLDRELLGERLWRLTDAAAVRPDVQAPGVPVTELQAAITDLERL